MVTVSCFTCLQIPKKDDCVPILGQTDEQRIADLLEKHLWFRREEFLVEHVLCRSCWTQLDNFHQFYQSVVQARLQGTSSSSPNTGIITKNETPEEILVKVEIFNVEDDQPDEGQPEGEQPEQEQQIAKKQKQSLKPKSDNNAKSCSEEEQIIKSHVQYICEICGIDSQTFQKFQKHSLEEHNSKGYVICCGRKYYKKTTLLEHVLHLTNPDLFKCDICLKNFANKVTMLKHKREIHQPEEMKIFLCNRCPKKFARQSQLSYHQKCHENMDNGTLQCVECEKFFPTESQLKVHIKRRHTEPSNFICDVCAQGFHSKTDFLRHKSLHELTPAEIRVQCDLCKEWLKDQSCFKKHYKRRHLQQPVACESCGHISPNLEALGRHKRNLHSERNTAHTCQLCDKTFKRAVYLKEHMASHTGTALYSCAFCPRTFNSNANLFAHRKKEHAKELLEQQGAPMQ